MSEPQSQSIGLASATNLSFLGTRFIAKRVRPSIAAALSDTNLVVIDFAGVDVTQSFIDELLGPLVLEFGEELLKRLAFRSCSETAQTIIRFVVSNRLTDYATLRGHSDPRSFPVA